MSVDAESPSVVGLTAAEVSQRRADGLTNDVPDRASRSIRDIVRANVFTRINAILSVLVVIVLATGSPIDALFGLAIVANSGVGMIQEIRAKRTLDALAIVGRSNPNVRRAEGTAEVAPADVVLDDIIEIGAGDQMVVDGEIVEAVALEVDESLLTGEADPIHKTVGDNVLSGSFVVVGGGAYRATKVGREAYAAKLAAEASKFTLVSSELQAGINRILTLITWLMLPAGALIVYNQLFLTGQPIRPALSGMVAALAPMVPEGLVLMTSIAFAVGVIRLGQRECLVNELPAIEGLARVDVVCADKTGTLTENGMRLSELRPLDGLAEDTLRTALAAMAGDDPQPNASMQAIAEAVDGRGPNWTATAVAPFSSAKKWSGISYGEHGNWYLGAPDVLLQPGTDAAEEAERIGSIGLRVLLVARSDLPVDDANAPGAVTPAALVVLEQKVREDARATLEYFAEQNVALKVISGDNALSVGAVASSLGLGDGSATDARKLPSDTNQLADVLEHETVFGRVRPDQKREMVHALQSRGHTVAMTGDGVNDVLALKDADIGVSMGSGSPATRAVAQIVLLDNKFATLPYVVGEGRRVIGNIERVANLFLTKTVYSVLLAFLIGFAGVGSQLFGYEPIPYPFLPRHITIVAWFTIGIPAFILSLAPNNERARSGFVGRVLRLAIPSGIVVGVATFVCYLLVYAGPEQTQQQQEQAGTCALITLIMIALWVLAVVARPYVWWKVLLLAGSVLGYVVIFAVPWIRNFFALDLGNVGGLTTAVICGGIGVVLVEVGWWVSGRLHGEQRRLFALPEVGSRG
ncbi:MAG TPA: HAD-IC family P-type ATPase [Aldersonia sp.]